MKLILKSQTFFKPVRYGIVNDVNTFYRINCVRDGVVYIINHTGKIRIRCCGNIYSLKLIFIQPSENFRSIVMRRKNVVNRTCKAVDFYGVEQRVSNKCFFLQCKPFQPLLTGGLRNDKVAKNGRFGYRKYLWIYYQACEDNKDKPPASHIKKLFFNT